MTFRPADKDAMLRELARDDTTIELDPTAPWNVNGRMPIGEGTLLDCHGATMIATGGSRLWIEQPGVTIQNLKGFGYFTIYAYTGDLTVEDVLIRHTLPGSDEYLDLAKTGGATAAFMVWGAGGKTVRNLTFRRCRGEKNYHHTFSLNLSNANEGGGFADVLYEQCESYDAGAIVPGRDPKTIWTCGMDIPDAGDIENMTVRDCLVDGALQDGFHIDGSWDGHRQIVKDVLFENCEARNCGQRCPPESAEKFRSGFYLQSGVLKNCRTSNCAGAGFALVNEVADSLTVEACRDYGSQYGMILNYAAFGAHISFVSEAATVRAFIGQAGSGGGTLDLTIRDFAGDGPAVTFGRALRADYIDCPNHQDAQASKYDRLGYSINRSGITITAADAPEIEEWKASKFAGIYQFFKLPGEKPPVVVDPVVPPVVIPPDPRDLGRLKIVDGAIWWAETAGGTFRQQRTSFLDEEALGKFRYNVEYGPEGA